MGAITEIYDILHLDTKIQSSLIRVVYLWEVWGLPQGLIADCEGTSQSAISRVLKDGRQHVSKEDIINFTAIRWSSEELKAIQFLSRDVITDAEVFSFMNDILQLEISHIFFKSYRPSELKRIAALARLGVRVGHIAKMFNRSAANTSGIVKRNSSNFNFPMSNRYSENYDYKVGNKAHIKSKFIRAGGIF
jgi:transcriptional regulator